MDGSNIYHAFDFILVHGNAGYSCLIRRLPCGIIIPRDHGLQTRIIDLISDVSMVMLLPLFFVFIGLRTQANILNTGTLLVGFALILVCAVTGKLVGSSLVGRALGQTWTNSFSIDVLMNTRGLMELIVLNIGYEMGILSTEIFSMMVLMALLTTLMTNPLLDWIGNRNN